MQNTQQLAFASGHSREYYSIDLEFLPGKVDVMPSPPQPVTVCIVAVAKVLVVIGNKIRRPNLVHILRLNSKIHFRLSKSLALETLILTSSICTFGCYLDRRPHRVAGLSLRNNYFLVIPVR